MAEAACPASNSKALQAARLALAHERALHHGDIAAAMHLAAEMCGLPDPTGATELQLRSGGLPPSSLRCIGTFSCISSLVVCCGTPLCTDLWLSCVYLRWY